MKGHIETSIHAPRFWTRGGCWGPWSGLTYTDVSRDSERRNAPADGDIPVPCVHSCERSVPGQEGTRSMLTKLHNQHFLRDLCSSYATSSRSWQVSDNPREEPGPQCSQLMHHRVGDALVTKPKKCVSHPKTASSGKPPQEPPPPNNSHHFMTTSNKSCLYHTSTSPSL